MLIHPPILARHLLGSVLGDTTVNKLEYDADGHGALQAQMHPQDWPRGSQDKVGMDGAAPRRQ